MKRKGVILTEFLGGLFAWIFGSHSILATIIIAMFPVIELKGAIPVGMNADFWGEHVLNGTQAFLFALLGSCLVVPILALLFNPIISWLKRTKLFRKLGEFIDSKVNKHSSSIVERVDKIDGDEGEKKRKKLWIKIIGVFSFVAVPLPLTGVWTGTCIAVAIGLNFWQTVISVVLGNMVAGIIITTICAIFPQFTTILFLAVLTFVIGIIVYALIKMFLSNKKENIETVEKDKSENN